MVLGSSLLGTVLNSLSGWLIKKTENKKHANFIALNLAHQFERYTYECLTVLTDHENAESSEGRIGDYLDTIPMMNDFPEFDYKVINLSLLDKIFDFPQQIAFAQNNLSFAFDVIDARDAVKEGHRSCLVLAEEALSIADGIREKYKFKKRELEFGEYYSVRKQLLERLEKNEIKAE